MFGEKHEQWQLQDYRRQFCAGALGKGAGGPSYAQVSFQSAYRRAHYPAEFIAAVINNPVGITPRGLSVRGTTDGADDSAAGSP